MGHGSPNPGTLGHKGVLARGKTQDLLVIGARYKQGRVAILPQKSHHLSVGKETLLINLPSLGKQIQVGGIPSVQARILISAKEMVPRGPVKIRGLCAVAHHSGKT